MFIGPERPPCREGGIFQHIPELDKFILFSGVSNKRFADIFLYDLKTGKWSKQKSTGEQPKNLCYAYGWYDSNYFFFYGGKNKELSLSDVYILDTIHWIWNKAHTVEQPLSRFFLSGAKINDKIVYIYGGCNMGKENLLLNDMYKYDYSKYY